jgi:hypothetical protein
MYTIEQLTQIANDNITVSYRGYGKRHDQPDWEGFNYTYTIKDVQGTYTKGLGHATKVRENGCSRITDNEVEAKVVRAKEGKKEYFNYLEHPFTHNKRYYAPKTTPIEILTSLISDAQCVECNTYEDFCSEFGYDTDSIKALKLYHDLQGALNTLRNLRINISEAYETLSEEGLM